MVFTVECFINIQRKFGVYHVIANGGSFLESGFSLLVGGRQWAEFCEVNFKTWKPMKKSLMDVSYPYDRNWHHVAMIYDAIKKHAMIYFDGKPATVPTAYKSPLIFNSKYLRIGENEMRRMGFNGGITDVRIWPKVLSSETIEKHANGETGGEPSKPLINLPLRFTNAEQAQEASGSDGFTAENINWRQGDQSHPMAGEEDWVYAQFGIRVLENGRNLLLPAFLSIGGVIISMPWNYCFEPLTVDDIRLRLNFVLVWAIE